MTTTMIAPGSPAAGSTRPPAQRDRAVNGQPDRTEQPEPRSGALDRPAARSYPEHVPSTPTHMSPEPGCVIHAQISEKDSDTGQAGRRALFVVGIDGQHPHRITPWALGGGDHAVFAPNGTILFSSYESMDGKQSAFWTVGPDGTGLRRLTHFKPGTSVLSASYAADGKWIVYGASGVGGSADIFVMRADGTSSRPMTRTKQWDSAPDWGPPSPSKP
ncbi:MAG TPA: hypothetical protein VE650_06025 [Acetobacteraceae bacterium]|jgi:Tol biopolymer transport system component|nr:hypothetical protein [Acetobacteraceae bacterium]